MNDIENTMHSILLAESEAIKNIPYSADYDRAVELIVEHVHRRHGKLVTSGMGKAGQIAMNIATTFSSTGIPAELNVKSSTTRTMRTDTMLTTVLSTAKDFSKSYSFVELPARNTSSSG